MRLLFLRFLGIIISLSSLVCVPGYTPKRLRASGAAAAAAAVSASRNSPKTWTDALGYRSTLSEFAKQQQQCTLAAEDGSSLSIFSYNILGPLHGESSKHDYAPVSITKWTRRRDKLLDELRSLNADVLCLQEVSQKALRETLIPGLRSVGLSCSAYAPTRVGQEAKGRFGHKSVGCAVFTR